MIGDARDAAWETGVGDLVVEELLRAFAGDRNLPGRHSDPFGANGTADDLPSWLEAWDRPSIRLRVRRLALLLCSIETGRRWVESNADGNGGLPASVRASALVSPTGGGDVFGLARLAAETSCDVPIVPVSPGGVVATRTRPVGARTEAMDGFAPPQRIAVDRPSPREERS